MVLVALAIEALLPQTPGAGNEEESHVKGKAPPHSFLPPVSQLPVKLLPLMTSARLGPGLGDRPHCHQRQQKETREKANLGEKGLQMLSNRAPLRKGMGSTWNEPIRLQSSVLGEGYLFYLFILFVL